MTDQDEKLEKARQLRQADNEMSMAEIARQVGVNKSTVTRWVRKGLLEKGNIRCGPPKGSQNAKGHGAPKGSKNHLKTGLYEDISYTSMTDEEKELYHIVDVSPVAVIERNLRSLAVRKLRMIKLRDKIEEQIAEEELHQLEETGGNNIVPRTVKEKTVRKQALLDKKLALEDAITRVEDLERRNAEALFRFKEKEKAEQKQNVDKIKFVFKR